jgi:predicted metallo-beta-lactamase superfamily hydrolase
MKKILWLKNPNPLTDPHQRKAAFTILKVIHEASGYVSFVDAHERMVNNTSIMFSQPVISRQDGTPSILQVAIRSGDDCFVFSSEVRGVFQRQQSEFLITQDPSFLYLDGPVTYVDSSPGRPPVNTCLKFIQNIIQKTEIRQLIIDHHLLRDVQWKRRIDSLVKLCHKKGISLCTAAEFRGQDNNLMESRRLELYQNQPVQDE